MYRSTASTIAGIPAIQDGIIAAAGGRNTATPLPKDINVVSAVAGDVNGPPGSAGAVRLPPAKAGIGAMVVNATLASITVYGYSRNDSIGLALPGEGFILDRGGADFTCVRDGEWGVILGSSLVVRAGPKLEHVSGFIDEPLFAPGEEPPPEPTPPMLWEYPPPDETPPPEPPPTEPAPTP
jgi:hypothetical protein